MESNDVSANQSSRYSRSELLADTALFEGMLRMSYVSLEQVVNILFV